MMHVTHMHESRRLYAWVMHHMNESCLWPLAVGDPLADWKWITPLLWICHVTRINEPYHWYKLLMSHMYDSCLSPLEDVGNPFADCRWITSHTATHCNTLQQDVGTPFANCRWIFYYLESQIEETHEQWPQPRQKANDIRCAISHAWRASFIIVDESRHAYAWVTALIWMRHATYTNQWLIHMSAVTHS